MATQPNEQAATAHPTATRRPQGDREEWPMPGLSSLVVLDTLSDPIAIRDPSFVYRFANVAFCELVRRPRTEIVGRTDFDLYPPDSANQYRAWDESAVAARLCLTNVEEHVGPHCKRWLQVTRRPLLNDNGGVIALVEQVRDITEGRDAREESTRFLQAVEQSACTVLITDIHGNIEYVNRKFTETTGYTRSEVIGQNPRILKSGELPSERYVALWETISSGREWRGEFHNQKKDGELYWVSATISPIFDDAGMLSHYLAIQEDITEQKAAEKALQAARRQQDLILATIPSVLIAIDRVGCVTAWSGTAERLFGIQAATVIGGPFKQCGIVWHMLDVIDSVEACISDKQPSRLDDVWFLRPDGSEGVLGVTLTPLQDEDGRPAGCVLLAADVTQRKSLESQLSQAQKLEAIGQLAAGIAHEINTPTQYVGDNTRFLQDAFVDLAEILTGYQELLAAASAGPIPGDLLNRAEETVKQADLDYLMAEIPAAIDQSREGVDRVSRIVRAMKDFSHPGSQEKTATDLNHAIESTITVSRNEWKYVATMETDLDPNLPLVPCLPAEINQVILNMITNAAYAIGTVVGDGGGKGTIKISTRQEGDWVEIRFSDDGCGIPPDAQPKIFHPFFTTKEVGKGTGQGLAISHAVVVEKHGGAIHFETGLGNGTTFVVRLPLKLDSMLRGQQ
ncbi:MAG: PAS domain S-box protein [Nitrospirota bacterium]|jgi:PAS domain S-box-containing protein